MKTADYKIEHWITAAAEADYQSQSPMVVKVDDRAATRRAIIESVRRKGANFLERKAWQAHAADEAKMEPDWDYSKIAIHHAGRSFSCSGNVSDIHAIQDFHLHHRTHKWPDIGYHYVLDCTGNIVEGRDIKFKGAHMAHFNGKAVGLLMLQDLSEPEDGDDPIAAVLKIKKKLGWVKKIDIPNVQRESLEMLIATLRDFFVIVELGGHLEFKGQQDTEEGKLCPGVHGMKLVEELREWSGLEKPEA